MNLSPDPRVITDTICPRTVAREVFWSHMLIQPWKCKGSILKGCPGVQGGASFTMLGSFLKLLWRVKWKAQGSRSLFLGLGHKQGVEHRHYEPEESASYGLILPTV